MANALPLYEPFGPKPFDYGRRAPVYMPKGNTTGRPRPYDYGRKPRGYKTPRRGNRLGRGAFHGVPGNPVHRRPAPLFHGNPLKRVPFGRAAWHSPVSPAGVPWKDILRRSARVLGGAIVVYEIWDAFDGIVNNKREVVGPFRDTDAGRYTASVPAGWVQCNHVPGRAPGTPTSQNRVYQSYPSPGFVSSMTLNPSITTNCATFNSNNLWTPDIGQSGSGPLYGGVYTRRQYVVGGAWSDNIVPWWMFSTPKGSPIPDPGLKFHVSPKGEPAYEGQVIPAYVAPPSILDSLLPASRPVASPAAHPARVPHWALPYVRQAQLGKRVDNGPIQVSPSPVPNPGRPPRGVKERKRKWAGASVLHHSKNVLNTTLETCDAIGEIWDALPGDVKWTQGLGRGKNCADKGLDIYKNFHRLDIDQALWNLVKMYGEDYLYGKYFATSDKVAKRLGFPGWKLDQPITEVMGNLPEEFRSALLDDIGNALASLMKG